MDRYLNLNKYIQGHSEKDFIGPEIHSIKTQTDYVKNSTVEKISELVPTRRLKRGLLNPLGSVIKLITGNLDNDDALRYDAMINEVKTQQNSIDRKVTVITEVLNTLIDSTNNSRTNFIQLDNAITNIRQRMNESYRHLGVLKIHNLYTLFFHNFQTLHARISEVETIIAFSKLGMLHQAVIDSNELLTILQTIERHNHKLVFPARLENVLKLETCIRPKIYVKGDQITFVLEIPLVDNDVYTYYKLLPLPITNTLNQTSLILPKFPYILAKGLKTVSLRGPCREVDESQFLCEEDQTSPFVRDECVVDLVTFAQDTSSCTPYIVNFLGVKVENILPNRWMVYTKKSIILTQDCNGEVTHHTIQGTYVVTLDDDCELEVAGAKLSGHRGRARDAYLPVLPIVDLPEVPLATRTSPEMKLVTLDNVELSNLQHLTNALKSAEVKSEIAKSESVIEVKKISVGTLILYIVLSIILMLFIRKLYVTRSSRALPIAPDNFELREGGVMHPDTRTVHVHTAT